MKRDRINSGVFSLKNSIFTVMFRFLKLLKKIEFQFCFCRILHFKPF